MSNVEGARTFAVVGATYDSYMGRYSQSLAEHFADAAGVQAGHTAVDVGCGPGALTNALVRRLSAEAVMACDPSPPFVADCAARHPGVRVELGRAEQIPFDDDRFDHAMAQLVLHFVSDPERAGQEMTRVVRPGGAVSACVWDFENGMEMLRAFWDAALTIDANAPDEAQTMKFGRPGEIAALFESTGLDDITESTLHVSSTYSGFDELWNGFMAGVGPAGTYCVQLDPAQRDELRHQLMLRLGSPAGPLTLPAVARCAVARVPAYRR